jgi:hypothetical protein
LVIVDVDDMCLLTELVKLDDKSFYVNITKWLRSSWTMPLLMGAWKLVVILLISKGADVNAKDKLTDLASWVR